MPNTIPGTIRAYHFEILNEPEKGKIKIIELAVKEMEKWESVEFTETGSQMKMSDALNLDSKYIRHVDFVGSTDKGVHSYEFKDLMMNYLIKSLILPTVGKLFHGNTPRRNGIVIVDGPRKWHGVWMCNGGNKYVHYASILN